MRRIAAALLGAVALLGFLTTPALAAPGGSASTAVDSAVTTTQNLITGAVVTVTNVTGTL
ncbi:hypothetical protein ACFWAT_08690 [Streptomyces syringium]|uniref:hypothetical protein n=1 Tax=Streptomyces syringium TaxID=76729 RepID=UPI003664AB41